MRGNRGHHALAHRPRLQRGIASLIATAAIWSLASGCSSPSYSDLAKIGHGVPTPSGLSYTGDTQSSDAAFPNANKDVSVNYANTSMTCDQLSAAWVAALTKARAHFDPVSPGALLIYMKNSHAVVSINMGLHFEGCKHPYVGVEPKQ